VLRKFFKALYREGTAEEIALIGMATRTGQKVSLRFRFASGLQHPMANGRIKPVSSAKGMNSAGDTMPR